MTNISQLRMRNIYGSFTIISRICLLYLFLYCTGERPVNFLNVVLKALVSVYPTLYITSLTFSRDDSRLILAASILTRWMYSTTVFDVAFLNRLSRFLLPNASIDAS